MSINKIKLLCISCLIFSLLVNSNIAISNSSVTESVPDSSFSVPNEFNPVSSQKTSFDNFAYLDTGRNINVKIKSLAAGKSVDVRETDMYVKAIRTSDHLPEGFLPSDSNTVSSASSPFPVYIFFDNTDETGIIYIYTDADRIIADSSLNNILSRLSALNDISGLANWDVSQVTEMNWSFRDTTSLTDISALSHWNTINVQTYVGTFFNSGIIDATPLVNWNTSSAVRMTFMFSNANHLRTIDVSHWDTSNVTDMGSMFSVGDDYEGNGQLSEIIGLANLDVSNVTDMTCMFYGAGNMSYYDISSWDVSNVQSFNHMFCDNFKLESLDLSAWNVSNVKTMCDMFDDNYSLTTIGDVSNWNTSSLVDAGGWMNGAQSFTGNDGILDLSGWNTRNLQAAGEMFRGVKLQTIDLSGWTFSSLTNQPWSGAGQGMYYETGNTSGYKGLAGMFLNASDLTVVRVSFYGFYSYRNAVSRGVDTVDMWTGVPEKGFTLPLIPILIQSVFRRIISFVSEIPKIVRLLSA